MIKATWYSKLGDVATQQLPFAIAQALNDTAREAAEEARTEAGKKLNVRNRNLLKFFIRAPAESKATKTRHTARVVVAGPKTNARRGEILAQQEDGGRKTATSGKYVAIPGRAITKGAGGKRDILRNAKLSSFKPFTRTGKVITGQKNTFLIKDKSSGLPVLLQRFGRGRRNARVLWIFVKQSRLTPKLGFDKAVKRTVGKNLTRNIGRSLTKAIATAKTVTQGGGVTSSRL